MVVVTLTATQIQARKHGVGCSELLAALGKDPRCSRLELYKRKVGELPEPDFSDNERVRWGNLLEDVIRQEVSRRLGHEIIVPQQTLVHPDVPLLGHLDGWIPALRIGTEIKALDKFEIAEFGEDESDQVPVRFLLQCSGYMALTDADRWKLCPLFGGNDLRMYDIPRNREIEEALLAGVEDFMAHVRERRPPDPQTPEEVRMRWPKDIGEPIFATDEIIDLCGELAVAKRELKVATEREDRLKSDIQLFMKDCSELIGPDGKPLATWRSPKPSIKLDQDRLQADHPDIYTQYSREVPNARRFLLKGSK